MTRVSALVPTCSRCNWPIVGNYFVTEGDVPVCINCAQKVEAVKVSITVENSDDFDDTGWE